MSHVIENSVRRRPHGMRASAARVLFILPVLAFLLLVFGYPIAFNIWLTFQSYDLKSMITGVSEFVGFANIVSAVTDPNFGTALLNTLFFTLASLFVQFIIGLALALFFYNNFPLSRTIRAMLVLPWLVPSIVATTAWRFIFKDPSGFLNQLLGVFGVAPVHWLTSNDTALVSIIIINIWIGIAFNLVLLHSGLQSIPTEQYEAAAIDCAGYWKRFWYITMPALRPVIAVLLVLGFVYTLKQFDLVWTLTKGGPGNSSQLLSTWSYSLSFQSNKFGQGAAVADVLFLLSGLIIIGYTYVQRKHANA
ncbi:carbohydrate ABC transporter permease [Tessaracoccus antarcticus]|uniref:Sugar ABC transporter permease n=1 Tax=Tessaracoccus antarcticus TaxID=2479848 RepID=A0A3M0G6T6_9ACTN|nr:sugar ABC transporter permease [Tessaracoccus antarcticus]RMB60228.1 sugar ABC transporter permease [Tessaracoccus antarcticus]